MMKTPFRTEQLPNGLQVRFTDLSNRYFGDYHRLCIEVQIAYDLSARDDQTASDPFWQQARTKFGPQLVVKRRLERMGVATAEVETVRAQMVNDFLDSTLTYLQQPNTLRALVESEIRKRRPRRLYGI